MRNIASCTALFLAGLLSVACGCGSVALLTLGLGNATAQLPPLPAVPATQRPATPHLSVEVPPHLDYAGVVNQARTWSLEAPGLTRIASYGRSRQQQELLVLEVGHLSLPGRLPVLVTACIHGNEPLSTSVVMGYIGRLLASYGKDERVTKILDTRAIYFVPVVSPDSYPHSRHVDGVDPNRDFPGPHDPRHQSTPSIAALQALFLKHRFKAAWSGHTSGRVFLTPWGDDVSPCPDDAAFTRLFGAMARLANYQHKRACHLYAMPIQGSEVDWYYRHGAASCVCEYGTHQRPATPQEIRVELDRTWPAFLLFLEQAPLLIRRPSEQGGPRP